MFTSRAMFIGNFVNGSFFVFSANDSKESVPVWTKYLSGHEMRHLAFLKIAIDY